MRKPATSAALRGHCWACFGDASSIAASPRLCAKAIVLHTEHLTLIPARRLFASGSALRERCY